MQTKIRHKKGETGHLKKWQIPPLHFSKTEWYRLGYQLKQGAQPYGRILTTNWEIAVFGPDQVEPRRMIKRMALPPWYILMQLVSSYRLVIAWDDRTAAVHQLIEQPIRASLLYASVTWREVERMVPRMIEYEDEFWANALYPQARKVRFYKTEREEPGVLGS